MIRVALAGAGGRMGRTILSLAESYSDIEMSGALDPASSGINVDRISDYKKNSITIVSEPAQALAGAAVVIDFSTTAATMELLPVCEAKQVALVLGVTGFEAEGLARIEAASQRIPILHAPNMSIGVNWLFRLTQLSARALPGYEVEITEAHHRYKKDAPSGTANRLLELVQETRAESRPVYGRSGLSAGRSPEEIGMHSLRAGDIVGEHTVYFVVDGERIELTHRATSRQTFARGALEAALFLAHQKPGLYGMQDVLG